MKSLEIKQISDAFEVTSSKRVFESDWTDSGVPFLRTREIVKLSNNEILENELFISEKMYKEYSDKYGRPQEGDLLVTAVGTLGATYIVKNTDKFYFKDGNVIWLKKKAEVSSKYIQYCFKSPFVKNQIIKTANSAVVGTYTITNAKKTQIPLPPLSKQQKIANILDAADELRQNDKALIAKYDELTQALFLDMFGNPVSNPKGLVEKELGDVLDLITYGLTVRPDYIEIGIPLISAREIRTGEIALNKAPKISIEDFNKLSNKGIPKINDVLFSKTGSIGHCALVKTPEIFAITQNAARLTFKENINPVYAMYYLKSSYIQQLSQRRAKGNAVKDLQLGDMKKFKFINPISSLQNQFAKRITLIEEQKAIAQKSLEKSEELFNSLLQKAFKGEL